MCFPKACSTSGGIHLAKASPSPCGEICIFPYILDTYLPYLPYQYPGILFSNMNWCNYIATWWNIYWLLLQFCFPPPSKGHLQSPISNKNRSLSLLSYPLKTAQIICCCCIKDVLASILQAATTSSFQLDMAKVRITHTERTFLSPGHTSLLCAWLGRAG